MIGSRNLTSVDISIYMPSNVTEIISGGAKGIDALAEKYADENGICKLIIKPEYNKYGKAAPLKRNETIVQISDMIIAIWDGQSNGTQYAINYAKKMNKPVEVHIISKGKRQKNTLNS